MKTKLDYTVRTTRAPGETTDTYIPMIVDRIQPTGLETVIEKCIDRGLIAGLKPTAAKTIAEGVAQQMAYEFAQGRGIQFDLFRGRGQGPGFQTGLVGFNFTLQGFFGL